MSVTYSDKFKRSEWFRYDRFGMFIHWGLYSIPARGEWARGSERIDDETYYSYFREFNPTGFDPAEWARAAKEAGMKYAVLTAKHHDGFCLFDSAYTDFKSTNTPCGRDLVREFLDAFRAEGLKVGVYYSLIDWNHPAYPAYQHHSHPHRDDPAYIERRPFSEYLTYMHSQVEELATKYGKLDIIWFDYSYGEMRGEKWEATKLVRMLRSHQPDILIDNRLEVSGEGFGSLMNDQPSEFSGDFASPECIIPPEGIRNQRGEPIPWEACITMNDNWGYRADDFNYKNEAIVVRKLVECVSKGGNLLLNVGPDATGRFPDRSMEILKGVGRWMRRNSEAIYGGGLSEFPKPEWGRYIQSGNTVYAMVMDAPVGPLSLPGIREDQIESCRLVSDGTEIKVFHDWRTGNYASVSYVNIPRYDMYNDIYTAIKITLKK